MANYHVTGNRSEGYNARRVGSSRSSGHFDRQSEAESRAKELAGNTGGGEVRIHGLDGRIRDSDTVAPGKDPNPPKDNVH